MTKWIKWRWEQIFIWSTEIRWIWFIHLLLWLTILWFRIGRISWLLMIWLIELRIRYDTIIGRTWTLTWLKTTRCICWPWWRIGKSTVGIIIDLCSIWRIMSGMRTSWITRWIWFTNNFDWNWNTLEKHSHASYIDFFPINEDYSLQLGDRNCLLKPWRFLEMLARNCPFFSIYLQLNHIWSNQYEYITLQKQEKKPRGLTMGRNTVYYHISKLMHSGDSSKWYADVRTNAHSVIIRHACDKEKKRRRKKK